VVRDYYHRCTVDEHCYEHQHLQLDGSKPLGKNFGLWKTLERREVDTDDAAA
jgi:hypothetical protein